MKTLQKMLKLDLIRWKNHDKICQITGKKLQLLNSEGSKDKKVKGTKNCVIKRRLKFENYKNCLEATQLENKINHVEKNKINIDSFFCYKRKHQKFIKKIILQTQQRFKSERHNVFTEEIDKIALSSIDDKRMQLIDSIEKYAYGTRKDLVRSNKIM